MKTKLTLSILASLVATSSFAVTASQIETSLKNYSVAANDRNTNDEDSLVYKLSHLKLDTIKFASTLPLALVSDKGYAYTKIREVKSITSDLKTGADNFKADTNVIQANKYANSALNDIKEGFATNKGAKVTDIKTTYFYNYLNNVDGYWNSRVAFWDENTDITEENKSTAYFNDTINYFSVAAVEKATNKDKTDAINDYANANRIAYTVTTLNDLNKNIANFDSKVAPNHNARNQLFNACNMNVASIKNNEKIDTLMQIVSHENSVNLISSFIVKYVKAPKSNINFPKYLADIAAQGIYNYMKNTTENTAVYKETAAAIGLFLDPNTCKYDAVVAQANQGKKFAQVMTIAVDAIANQMAASGKKVDEAYKENIYLALVADVANQVNTQLNNF